VKISEVNIVPENLVFQFFSFAHFIDQFLALEKYVPKYVEFTVNSSKIKGCIGFFGGYHIYICIKCMYIYIYIYIYSNLCRYDYMYVICVYYVYTYTTNVYVYIHLLHTCDYAWF